MIYTEFMYGQGFGNQLAVYVTTRAIAKRNGYKFGYKGLENLSLSLIKEEQEYTTFRLLKKSKNRRAYIYIFNFK